MKLIKFAIILPLLSAYACAQSSYLEARWCADSLFQARLFANCIPILHYCIKQDSVQRADYYKMAVCQLSLSNKDSAFYYMNIAAQKGLRFPTISDFYANSDIKMFLALEPKHSSLLQIKENSSFNAVTYKHLQKKLLKRSLLDQKYRNIYDIKDTVLSKQLHHRQRKIDLRNQKFLKNKIKKYGWLGYEKVGEDGDNAAWLIVQHADNDLPFQEKCLSLIRETIAINQKNPAVRTNLSNYAYLTDRVLINKGKKQRYGTQYSPVYNGTSIENIIFKPMESESKVDKLRNLLGMPPIAWYKQKAIEHMKNNK
jgi:hypothetical protein